MTKQIMKNENDILVEVEGLSKKFCKDLKTSLKYGLQDLFNNALGKAEEGELRKKEFWAVKDISFTLRRGECLGLIGHNGAGKSTLLKILNGLINPDLGKVTIRGKVSALIELGAGFNPILSGRENIYNNGAVLGFTKSEIDAKVEEIIDFAEIREFIDMPVQNYSSGMRVRLGFAVAAQMEPDVLIIDEVLAVGDVGFILKCFKVIDTILPKTAVIFVSHNMPQVSRMCNQVILMDRGEVKYQGYEVSKGLDLYYKRFTSNKLDIPYDDGNLSLVDFRINGKNYKEKIVEINWNSKCIIDLIIKSKLDFIPQPYLVIFDKEERPIAELSINEDDFKCLNKENIHYKFTIPKLQLSKGVYNVTFAIYKSRLTEPYLRVTNIMSIQIIHHQDIWSPLLVESNTEVL